MVRLPVLLQHQWQEMPDKLVLGMAAVALVGGGAGGYIDGLIFSPGATYTYFVGSGGGGGAAGTSGAIGGGGANGLILIDAFSQ